MPFTDRIKKGLAAFGTKIDKLKDVFINEELAAGTMILAAWVTAADGKIDDREIEETEKFIMEFELFERMNKKMLSREYRKWCLKFNKQPEDAVVHALIGILPLREKPQAKPALQLAACIARADGVFSEEEKNVITRAAHYLVLDPDEFLNNNA